MMDQRTHQSAQMHMYVHVKNNYKNDNDNDHHHNNEKKEEIENNVSHKSTDSIIVPVGLEWKGGTH